jgi:hypothetical protein
LPVGTEALAVTGRAEPTAGPDRSAGSRGCGTEPPTGAAPNGDPPGALGEPGGVP